jgi:hypothetical protein
MEGVAWSAQRIPTTVNLGFLDRRSYFSIQVAPQLSSSNASDLCSGDAGFESRPGNRLSWVKFFVVFSQSLRVTAKQYFKVDHYWSVLYPLHFIIQYHPIFRRFIVSSTDSVLKNINKLRCRQDVPPKSRYLSTRLHGVTFQKAVMFVVTAPRNLNLTYKYICIIVLKHSKQLLTEALQMMFWNI